ncbi:MAG: hypothetical protein AABW67_04260 [Nanoarchaeota archaeon]
MLIPNPRKCEKCGDWIKGKVGYFNKNKVCQKCYNKFKWKNKHEE